MKLDRIALFIAALLVLPPLMGCQSIPKKALALEEQSMEWRHMQTRRFDTNDEKKILIACAGLLQDLGFTLEESETELGVVVGQKDRSAAEAGQVIGAILFAGLTGSNLPIDATQKLRASVITRPQGENTIVVRVTFQRIVWNNRGMISKLERLNDPEQYQEFFQKLSEAVFLDAHEI